MPPKLATILAQMLAKEAQLQTQGVTVSDQNRDEYIRKMSGGSFTLKDAAPYLSTDVSLQNLARSGAQGALGNYADELQGLVQGKDAEAVTRAMDARFQHEHPVADFAARTVGQLATLSLPWAKIAEAIGLGAPMAAAARALPAAETTAGAAARAALQAGGVGAVDASGQGTSLPDRLERGAIGGAAGTVLGGVLGGATAKVMRSTPARAALARMRAAVQESGGTDAAKASARALDAAGRGDVAIAGDLSGRMQRETDFAANNNPDTYAQLAGTLNARQATMGQRMLGDVTDLAGTPNAEGELRALQESNRAWAKTAYDDLRAKNPEVPMGPVAQMAAQPVVGPAFEKSLATGQIGPNPEPPVMPATAPDASALPKLGAVITGGAGEPIDPAKVQQMIADPVIANTLRAAGHGDLVDAALGKEGQNPTFRAMLSLKGRLNGLASSAFTRGDGDLGKALADAHDALTAHLRNVVDGFAKVNDEFAARKRLEEAITGGQEAWNSPKTRLLSSDIDALPKEQQDLFRRAMASELIDWLRSVGKNQNEAGRVVNASPSMEEKLKAIFHDEHTFDSYMERAKAELTMARTKNAVGGSQTHLRDAESMFDPLEMFQHGAPTPAGLWAMLMRATKGKMNAATAAEVGKMVGTQGTPNIMALLDALEQPKPLITPAARKVGAATMGSLFSQF